MYTCIFTHIYIYYMQYVYIPVTHIKTKHTKDEGHSQFLAGYTATPPHSD